MALEDELLQKQMPHSLEAEQSVLGSILIDSECVAEVIGIIRMGKNAHDCFFRLHFTLIPSFLPWFLLFSSVPSSI